ncbi:hypothetical protein ACQR1H_28650 [Bradyrhizobium sp. HKCCYLRH2015]|uniref:LpxL/LpxP family acyltransferase n=1 Tax=Bradyrhizobium TaxID=374 RepID=UPI003EB7AA19
MPNDLHTVLSGIHGLKVDAVERSVPACADHAFAWAGKLLAVPHPRARADFSSAHQRAWLEAMSNLSAWKTRQIDVNLPASEKLLIVGWYFPELASLLGTAKEKHVVVLVSNDAPWLSELKDAGTTLNFRAEGGASALAAYMREGRNVFAMMDNIHPGTEFIRSPFFGRPAKTPAAILRLAIRNGYTLALIAPRDNRVEVVATLPTAGKQPEDLAAWVNQKIEQEVRRAPERWLSWPTLAYRFQAS